MPDHKTKSIVYLLIVIFLLGFTSPLAAEEAPYIVADASTGEILLDNRSNDLWHPASLTKLMTAYVTFQAIKNGEIEDGSPVFISREATRQPPSRMGYKKGVTLRIDRALEIIIVKSANDVSHALAEAVAGTVENFVTRMNNESRRLGLVNTRFGNSNGLHLKNQVTTARDMAVLSAVILKKYPEFAYLFETVAIQTSKNVYYSYNLLLERFSGTNGMKTGFVCASGYNIVASATRNGRTLIAVVLGRASQTDRADTAARLLTEAFSLNPQATENLFVLPPVNPSPARNMRSVLCTEKARAARYDPAPGNAKIESPYLEARKKSDKILSISTGGVDAEPSDAYFAAGYLVPDRPAIPKKNPGYNSIISADKGSVSPLPVGTQIPVPVFRMEVN